MKYSIAGLPKKQISVLKSLGVQMSPRGFYLAGGTALAIHLAHRISVDLDWFTPDSFPDGMMLAQSLRNSDVELEIEQVSAWHIARKCAGCTRYFSCNINILYSSRLSNGRRWIVHSLHSKILPA